MFTSQTVPISTTQHNRIETHFVIGQDKEGHWLALETHRLGGGLFTSRQSAVHFVELETGHRSGAYEFASAPLSLTF